MITLIGFLLAVISFGIFFRASNMARYINNSEVGIVEKLWSSKGSIKGGFIALNGEAGFQPEILRGGLHFMKPFQYRVRVTSLVNIPQGQIGYVYARDGVQLQSSQTLGVNTVDEDFQDVRKFLANGGQKGPQRKILREGTFAINLAQFVVLTEKNIHALSLDKAEEDLFNSMAQTLQERQGFRPVMLNGGEDTIGIVITHEGPSLPEGELLATICGTDSNEPDTFHNNFQDIEKFLKAGGRRGRQHQVLVEGSYYINRLFATVEFKPKTVIEVGTVGVVVSYVGPKGEDSSGEDYRHGELVKEGCRGVWKTPKNPGKYAFNPYSGKIISVPTTNFLLRWESATSTSHKFDENLKEVSLITKDAFEPSLPLSVVVHIDYLMAPMVVQRFGDIKKLVEQTLDPMVSAFFKNIAQGKTMIELLQDRSKIQMDSKIDMKEKFGQYNLELLEVLIGTPNAGEGIEKLLTQLRERQVAVEQVETYELQEKAAKQERSLREARAIAEQQEHITQSELAVVVETNKGRATKARAALDAETVEITAKATSARLTLEGTGEAAKILSIGKAEAEATKSKVDAYGGPQYQLTSQVMTRFAEAIENGKIALVPQVQVGGGSGSGAAGGAAMMDNSVLSGLMTMMMAERAGVQVGTAPPTAAPAISHSVKAASTIPNE